MSAVVLRSAPTLEVPELPESLLDGRAALNRVEIGASQFALRLDPRTRLRRVDVLHPPVGIRYFHPVIVRGHVATGGRGIRKRVPRSGQRTCREQRHQYDACEHAPSLPAKDQGA